MIFTSRNIIIASTPVAVPKKGALSAVFSDSESLHH